MTDTAGDAFAEARGKVAYPIPDELVQTDIPARNLTPVDNTISDTLFSHLLNLCAEHWFHITKTSKRELTVWIIGVEHCGTLSQIPRIEVRPRRDGLKDIQLYPPVSNVLCDRAGAFFWTAGRTNYTKLVQKNKLLLTRTEG